MVLCFVVVRVLFVVIVWEGGEVVECLGFCLFFGGVFFCRVGCDLFFSCCCGVVVVVVFVVVFVVCFVVCCRVVSVNHICTPLPLLPPPLLT